MTLSGCVRARVRGGAGVEWLLCFSSHCTWSTHRNITGRSTPHKHAQELLWGGRLPPQGALGLGHDPTPSEAFGVPPDHHTTVMTCYQLVAVCAALTKAFK